MIPALSWIFFFLIGQVFTDSEIRQLVSLFAATVVMRKREAETPHTIFVADQTNGYARNGCLNLRQDAHYLND